MQLYPLTTPIIHEDHPEDVFISSLHCNGFAKGVARASEEGHLEFEVEQPTGPKHGWLSVVRFGLSRGSAQWSARHHHARGTAVVTNWQVTPGTQTKSLQS